MRIHAGPSNSHRLAILDLGLKYNPIAATNADAQFIESKEISIRDIARRYGFTVSKVKSLLHRTRKGLREHLIREGYAL